MATTPKFGLGQLVEGQTGGEVKFSEAMLQLDTLLHAKVINATTNTPPGSPTEGDTYLISSSPTGAWSGKAGYITVYFGGQWKFFAKTAGMTIWDASLSVSSAFKIWDGSAWRTVTTT